MYKIYIHMYRGSTPDDAGERTRVGPPTRVNWALPAPPALGARLVRRPRLASARVASRRRTRGAGASSPADTARARARRTYDAPGSRSLTDFVNTYKKESQYLQILQYCKY